MTIRSPFFPLKGSNQVVTGTVASASVSIDSASLSVRVVNAGVNIAHFRIGTGAQTATTADTPLLSGASLIVAKNRGDDTLAYVSTLGATLHIQAGEGGV